MLYLKMSLYFPQNVKYSLVSLWVGCDAWCTVWKLTIWKYGEEPYLRNIMI